MAKKSAVVTLAGAGILGYIIYRILTTASVSGSVSEQAANWWSNVQNALIPGSWATAGDAPIYVPYIQQIEQQFGIPTNLLARVAYQESHFRSDIVDGTVRSSAGAIGLFQLMPQYYPNAGASWQADTQTAAQALVSYYNEFGDWQLALAAYNWGPGNVDNWTKTGGTFAQLPTETQAYVSDVVADVPVSGPLIQSA